MRRVSPPPGMRGIDDDAFDGMVRSLLREFDSMKEYCGSCDALDIGVSCIEEDRGDTSE